MINEIRIRPSLVCYHICNVKEILHGVSLFRVSVPILLIAWAMGASAGTGGNCTRAFLFSAAACLLFTCSVTAGDIKLVNPVIKAFVPGSLAFHLTQISQVNIFFVASSRRYLFVFFQFSKVAVFTPPPPPTRHQYWSFLCLYYLNV